MRLPDEQVKTLYTLYQSGKTIREIAKVHAVPRYLISIEFQRCGYRMRGLREPRNKPSIVPGIDDGVLLAAKQQWDALDSLAKGTITEGHVKNKLLELGFDVWMPCINNHKADLAVFVRGRLLRIQVKCATYDAQTKRFRTMLQTRDKAGNHIGYQDGVVDFFIVYCPGVPAFYVIPASVGNSNQGVNLLPHRQRLFGLERNVDWEQYQDAFDLLRMDGEEVA